VAEFCGLPAGSYSTFSCIEETAKRTGLHRLVVRTGSYRRCRSCAQAIQYHEGRLPSRCAGKTEEMVIVSYTLRAFGVELQKS
jgi:hypothetical protein